MPVPQVSHLKSQHYILSYDKLINIDNLKEMAMLTKKISEVMRNRVSSEVLCHSTKRLIETRFLAPMGDEKPGF